MDDDHQIGYQALPRGVPVFTSDGAELLTCIAGEAPPLGQDDVQARVPDGIELEYHEGGQPAWWWLLCAE